MAPCGVTAVELLGVTKPLVRDVPDPKEEESALET